MWQLYHMHFVAHWALCARLGDARFVPFCSPPWTANNTEAHSSKVQAFYSQKLEEGLSPRSVILIHAVLHQALENAVKWGLVPRNVTKLVSLPHVGRYDAQILTTDQSALSATLALHIKSVLDIVVDDSARTIRAVQM